MLVAKKEVILAVPHAIDFAKLILCYVYEA